MANKGTCTRVFLINCPEITICSWCGASFFPPILTVTGDFVAGDLCYYCTVKGDKLGLVYYNCPNMVNCCNFVGVSSEMRPHIKSCEFALAKCVFCCCSWVGVLTTLRHHLCQTHYVLPHDIPEMLKPCFVFVIVHEQSFFLIKLKVNEDVARFSVFYYGPSNKYSLSVRLGLPPALFFSKRRLVPSMHTFNTPRINFTNSLIIDFDLSMFKYHLKGANIFEKVSFRVNVSSIAKGGLNEQNLEGGR